MLHLLTGLFFIAVTLSGCGKYEEGPAVSFRSKKERVANTWEVNEQTYNGSKVDPSNYENVTITFDKDGNFSTAYGAFSVSGEWEFNDDKTKIITTVNSNESEATILKLKEKELWTEEEDSNGNKTETHYVPS